MSSLLTDELIIVNDIGTLIGSKGQTKIILGTIYEA